MNNKFTKHCCAVIVSYNPGSEIASNVRLLRHQVSEIVIIDNASSSVKSLTVLEDLSREEYVNIIYNQNNLGIATALNQGIRYASERNYKWLATFDQDSLAAPDYIQVMLDTYDKCKDNKSVAIISPRYLMFDQVISSSSKEYEEEYTFVKTAITSGSMIRTNIFNTVSLFNDYFFIDYVDFEFSLRCRKAGFKIMEVRNALLTHTLGISPHEYKLMGSTIKVTNHSPIRRFYKHRNKILMYFDYFNFDLPWILNDIKSSIYDFVKIILFEDCKMLKIINIFLGISHGFFKVISNKVSFSK